MSVRCQLGFYDNGEEDLGCWRVLIYRHFDGFPKSVLADIIPILTDFAEARSLEDIEYAAAYVVSKLKTDYSNIGISKQIHSDLDYFYQIFPFRIKVFQCRYSQPPKKWTLIKTVLFGMGADEVKNG